jgi:predicted small lipoprotein YifL
MIRRIFSILLPMLFALALVGCGSKGALVMPDQQPAKKKHEAKPAPATVPATPVKPASTPPASGDGSGQPQ